MATLLPRTLIALGLLLLAHACYSAYEHSSLLSHASTSTSPSSPNTSNPQPSNAQPLDISLETIFSVALICFGLVAGMEELQPIAWRVWAGKVETEGNGMGVGRGGPWAGLEERMGFVDIRAKRKDFADWVRNQGKEGKR